jgi:hypothetical protein
VDTRDEAVTAVGCSVASAEGRGLGGTTVPFSFGGVSSGGSAISTRPVQPFGGVSSGGSAINTRPLPFSFGGVSSGGSTISTRPVPPFGAVSSGVSAISTQPLPFSFGGVSSGGSAISTRPVPPFGAVSSGVSAISTRPVPPFGGVSSGVSAISTRPLPFSFGGVSSGGSAISTRPDTFTELRGEDSVLATSHTINKHKPASGDTSKRSVDEIGTAMDEHGHNGKASKVFAADSPEHSDPLEKLALLHIPRRLELQSLLKSWDLARRDGSRSHVSGNLIFVGPQGKFPLS